MFKEHLHPIALFSLSFALLLSVFAFASISKNFKADLKQRNLMVSSLIDEIGELQEENLHLTKEMKQKGKEFDFLVSRVSDVSSQIEEYNDDMAEWSILEKSLEKVSKKPLGTIKYPTNILDVLILGTHGGLTDTIMLASANPSLKTITLMSIPRDLYVGGRKINEHYNSYGIEKLEEAVEDITGVTPDKYMVVDMQTFSKAIDAIDGITVTVEKDLSDLAYPGPNGTYTTFSIAKGTYTFDGETALKYARSRHSTSDFDRAVRQQKIAQAILAKIKEKNFLSQVETGMEILSGILPGMKTDASAIELLAYLKKYEGYTLETGNVLTTANYLYSTTNQRGQYILLPKSGNFGEVQQHISELILIPTTLSESGRTPQ